MINFAKKEDGEEFSTTIDKITFNHNTDQDERTESVKSALARNLPQFETYERQDQVIALVGGGPSLEDTFDDLKEKHENGMKVVSMNGTHDYLIERGIIPSVHIQLDARQHNARFVKNWNEKTKYFIASQSHPDVFDALEGANVTMFHCQSSADEKKILDDHYKDGYISIPGGTTVMLRAIPLMRMLGFEKMEVFGFDSCVMRDDHHAYPQKENDIGPCTTIEINDKEFLVYGWMYSQAKDFIEMMKAVGDAFELVVHGDGLIANIIKASASKLQEK